MVVLCLALQLSVQDSTWSRCPFIHTCFALYSGFCIFCNEILSAEEVATPTFLAAQHFPLQAPAFSLFSFQAT